MPTAVLVDTVALLATCLADLSTHAIIAVDLEGVELCRTGRVCLLQLFGEGSRFIWVIDVTVLGSSAFAGIPGFGNLGSLRAILQDPQVQKVNLLCVLHSGR